MRSACFLKSITTERLLRFQVMNGALSPLTKGGMLRAESPVGGSILMTSAPWSASIIAQYGTERWLVRSRTRRWSSAPGILFPPFGRQAGCHIPDRASLAGGFGAGRDIDRGPAAQ